MEIVRVNAEARERARAEAKAIVREKTNDVQRVAVEAATKIRSKVEAEREKRERGHRLRQGPRLRPKSRKRRRKRGRKGSQGRRGRMRLQRYQRHGLRPKQGRRQISPSLMTRLGRRLISRRGRGIMPTL